MRVTRRLDEAAWGAFVSGHPHATIFHTPEMFRVFESARGHRPELWAVVDGGSDILALLVPVHVVLREGVMRRLTARSIVYGSVLCEESSYGQEGLMWLLDSYLRVNESRSLFTELRNHTERSELADPLLRCGFAYEPHLNYRVDLARPTDEIFARFGRRTRKAIRSATRKGQVRVREITDRDDLVPWYGLLKVTYSKAGVPLAHRSLFEAAFDTLLPAGMIRFLLAEVGERPVACSAELLYRDTIYGWYGGSDRAFSRYLPNELLTWDILEWGAANGYRTYDFGGAGKPDEGYGVRNFKAKFGGALVEPGRYVYVHSPGRLRLSAFGYRISRPLVAKS